MPDLLDYQVLHLILGVSAEYLIFGLNIAISTWLLEFDLATLIKSLSFNEYKAIVPQMIDSEIDLIVKYCHQLSEFEFET